MSTNEQRHALITLKNEAQLVLNFDNQVIEKLEKDSLFLRFHGKEVTHRFYINKELIGAIEFGNEDQLK